MARPIWSGSITFGLINVPVRMFSAVREHRLHFRYIHEPDGSPIGYEKFCKAEGKPVPDEEIVKAFEWEKGEMVPMRDEDFEAAQAEGSHRSIEIRDFVSYEEIDPVYFERTYYLEPTEDAGNAYALLVEAMREAGRAAIAKFVMRDRQHLACLRVTGDVLALERMHFADEVQDPGTHAPEKGKVSKRELEIARSLIGELSGEWQPERYEDTYRDTLCEIIETKREGEAVEVPEVSEPKKAPDLMAALEASLKEVKAESNGKRNGLEKLSKKDLYERAKRADIPGRADMSKDELLAALRG